jgi:hypothetical protein
VFLQSISLLNKVKSLQLKWTISGGLEKKKIDEWLDQDGMIENKKWQGKNDKDKN